MKEVFLHDSGCTPSFLFAQKLGKASLFILILVAGLLAIQPQLLFSPDGDASAIEDPAKGDLEVVFNVPPHIGFKDLPTSIESIITPEATGELNTSTSKFVAESNNPDGFVLSLSSINAHTELSNGKDASIPTLENNTSAGSFASNRWGFSLDGGNTFRPLKSLSEAENIVTTESTDESGDVEFMVGAKVDNSLASGTYFTTMIFSLVPNLPADIRIIFDANGGTNAPEPQLQEIGQPITLTTNTPTPPSGKDFAGWATSSTATEPEYEAGGTYTFPSSSTSVMLYAVYEDATEPMQNYNCANLSSGQSTQLKDTRDGKKYLVAKLKDGNCWMVDNLRFAGTNSSGEKIVLNSNNSDLNSGVTFDLIGSTPSAVPYNLDTTWLAKYDASEYYPDESQSGGQYYGYFYNWYAAIAGTVSGQVQQDGTGSICPKGWTLPHNYTASNPSPSYSDLLYKYGIIANIVDNYNYASGKTVSDLTGVPLRFILAGYHDNTSRSVSSRGSAGRYWSSTSDSDINAMSLVFSSSIVRPQLNFYYKSYGFSVRCVAR